MGRPPRRLVRTVELITGQVPLPSTLSAAERAVFERLRELVLGDAIEGVAISRKEAGGVETREDVIVFYVSEKLPLSRLSPETLVPPVILDGSGRAVLTDVRRIGRVIAQLNAAASPIRSGFSIGHRHGSPGTLGAVVRVKGRPYLLSAKHVLANDGTASAGDPVCFPAMEDGGEIPDSHVADLVPFQPYILGAGFPNEADAALAQIHADRIADLDPAIPGVTTPLKVADPFGGMRVRLVGRSSSAGAEAFVRGLVATPRPYFAGLGRKVGFHGQVECRSYTEGGDSGALVVDADTGAVVGIHMAGSSEGSFFTPIRRVMKLLSFVF